MKTATLTGISQTALWTLRSRADEHMRPDRLFDDSQAAAWYAEIGEAAETDDWYSESLQTTIAIRTKLYDDAITRFVAAHDSPVIVELGAGFSTRYARLGSAASNTSHWLEIDLPDVIAARRQLETETAAHRLIGASVLDTAWIQAIRQASASISESNKSNGSGKSGGAILFAAEGLFMFLTAPERQQLIEQLRRAFPGSTLLLDVSGKLSQYGEAALAAKLGAPLAWLVEDEWDVVALGVKLTQVWPLLEQYPQRVTAMLNGTPYHHRMRNAALLVESTLPAWEQAPQQAPVTISSSDSLASVAGSTAIDSAIADGSHADPIYFRGHAYRAAKQFVYGTHRACPPDETLARIKPHFRRAGITRVADITGLDRIGIPVTLVIRPNAPTMSNSTGKGFTLMAATVSGAMESIEIYHAENTRFESVWKSYNDIAQQQAVMPLALLPRIKNDAFHPDLPEEWAFGWDIMQQREVAVPAALVGLVRDNLSLGTMINFQVGSNGLASGNHLPEALTAGLLEVIERDAVACQQTAWRVLDAPPPKVKLDTIQSVPVQDLLRRFQAARIKPVLFDMTVDTRIPVYMAYIYDTIDSAVGVAAGFGAHLHPEIAMIRALTEAAQSRVVLMAGSRDEHFRHHRALFQKLGGKIQTHILETIPETVSLHHHQSMATSTFEGDIAVILRQLRHVGIDQSIVFDLTLPGFDISVVRVVVPALEGYMFAYYKPGPRARAFVAKRRAELQSAT